MTKNNGNWPKPTYHKMNKEQQRQVIAALANIIKGYRKEPNCGRLHFEDNMRACGYGDTEWKHDLGERRHAEYTAMGLLAEYKLKTPEYNEFVGRRIDPRCDWAVVLHGCHERLNRNFVETQSLHWFADISLSCGLMSELGQLTDSEIKDNLDFVVELTSERFGDWDEPKSHDYATKSHQDYPNLEGVSWHAAYIREVFEQTIDDPVKRPPVEDIEFIVDKWVEKFGGLGSWNAVARAVAMTYVMNPRNGEKAGQPCGYLTESPNGFQWDLR